MWPIIRINKVPKPRIALNFIPALLCDRELT